MTRTGPLLTPSALPPAAAAQWLLVLEGKRDREMLGIPSLSMETPR